LNRDIPKETGWLDLSSQGPRNTRLCDGGVNEMSGSAATAEFIQQVCDGSICVKKVLGFLKVTDGKA